MRNHEIDMKSNKVVIDYLRDRAGACEFYAALCNMQWEVIIDIPDDEKIIEKLMGKEPEVWSCTWRYAGGIIADIRHQHYSEREDYMDFYCSGNEGEVTELVRECFERLGWKPRHWD